MANTKYTEVTTANELLENEGLFISLIREADSETKQLVMELLGAEGPQKAKEAMEKVLNSGILSAELQEALIAEIEK